MAFSPMFGEVLSNPPRPSTNESRSGHEDGPRTSTSFHTHSSNTSSRIAGRESEQQQQDTSQAENSRDSKKKSGGFRAKLHKITSSRTPSGAAKTTSAAAKSSSDSKKSLQAEHAVDLVPEPDQEAEIKALGVKTSLYLDPLAYTAKLRPRREKGYLPRPDIPSNPDIPLSGITIARHRAETALTLAGYDPESDSEPETRGYPELFDEDDMRSDTGADQAEARHSREDESKGPDQGRRKSVARSEKALLDPTLNQESRHPLGEDLMLQDQVFEHAVAVMAPDNTLLEPWVKWLSSYAQGQFNMIDPPDPPQARPDYGYLPSIRPPNELLRVSICAQLDELWPYWGQDRAADLIRSAMTDFDTKFMSLSFFDERHEVFKAENGYDQSCLDRTISIAAHVLLSNDVLVILDTKKDWRFRNNPLVTGRPKIRFFAGAPMISPCGQVLGVFAIFGPKPRRSFNHTRRRDLAAFSSTVLDDLTAQLESMSVLNSPIVLPAHPAVDLAPHALRYQKAERLPPTRSRLHVPYLIESAISSPAAYTPPTTAESKDGAFYEKPTGFEDQHRLSGRSRVGTENPASPSIAHYSRGLRPSSPRPFSSSDLTSLYPHPPNTPAHSVTENDLSTDPRFDMMSQRFTELGYEGGTRQHQYSGYSTDSRGSVGLQTSANAYLGGSVNTGSNLIWGPHSFSLERPSSFISTGYGGPQDSDDSRSTLKVITQSRASRAVPDDGTGVGLPVNIVASSRKDIVGGRRLDSGFDAESSKAQRLSDKSETSNSVLPTTEEKWTDIGHTCSLNARNLGYDLMYLVEITQVQSLISFDDLEHQDGVEMRVLTVYGSDKFLELEASSHLRALRLKGNGALLSNQHHHEEGDYEHGYLMPIHVEEGPAEYRSTGIILGAFRKTRSRGFGDCTTSKEEWSKIQDFAVVLQEVIPMNLPVQKQQTRYNTSPVSQRRFPPFEAREMRLGKHSLNVSRHLAD